MLSRRYRRSSIRRLAPGAADGGWRLQNQPAACSQPTKFPACRPITAFQSDSYSARFAIPGNFRANARLSSRAGLCLPQMRLIYFREVRHLGRIAVGGFAMAGRRFGRLVKAAPAAGAAYCGKPAELNAVA